MGNEIKSFREAETFVYAKSSSCKVGAWRNVDERKIRNVFQKGSTYKYRSGAICWVYGDTVRTDWGLLVMTCLDNGETYNYLTRPSKEAGGGGSSRDYISLFLVD